MRRPLSPITAIVEARSEPPVVIVAHVHAPLAVITGSSLLVVGIAFAILCASHYRRTAERSWIVLGVAAVALALVSAAGLVVHVVRAAG